MLLGAGYGYTYIHSLHYLFPMFGIWRYISTVLTFWNLDFVFMLAYNLDQPTKTIIHL